MDHGLTEKVLVCRDFIKLTDKSEDQADDFRHQKCPVHRVFGIALGHKDGGRARSFEDTFVRAVVLNLYTEHDVSGCDEGANVPKDRTRRRAI